MREQARQINLTVLSHALVTRLTFQGKRATGVEISYRDAIYRIGAAVEVVLSLGAIHTPKVLAVELAPLGIHVTAVAPGLFTTDFLSAESYVAAKTIIADYQETVGPRRSGADALHGHQPGDPKKFAQVIVQLANTERPPLHFPVGKDAIALYRSNATKMVQEIEAWLPVSTSTDHDLALFTH